jgi:hypothetical protein
MTKKEAEIALRKAHIRQLAREIDQKLADIEVLQCQIDFINYEISEEEKK